MRTPEEAPSNRNASRRKEVCNTQSTVSVPVCSTQSNTTAPYNVKPPICDQIGVDEASVTGNVTSIPQRRINRPLISKCLIKSLRKEPTKQYRKVKNAPKYHSKRCQRYNRFRNLPDAENYPSGRHHRNEGMYLEEVEYYREQKFVLECVCEGRRCSRLNDCWFVFRRFLRLLRRSCFLICCPPWPSCFLQKVAFWPPQREYFFFVNENPHDVGADAAQKAPIKMRKANAKMIKNNNGKWRFGLEHECLSEVTNIEAFCCETDTGNFLACVLVKCPHPNPRYTLLFSHPNGSDISDHLTGVPSLHSTAQFLNCQIVVYDYSGYGISSGRPSEQGLISDVDAVFKVCAPLWACNLLSSTFKQKSKFHGKALYYGASVLEHGAQYPDVAAVILFAPPASLGRTLCGRCCFSRRGENKHCCLDKFEAIDRIHKVSVPLLIIHGNEDEMVPVEHGKMLYEFSGSSISPLWVLNVGHNNLENSKEVWIRMRKFLHLEARPPAPKTAIELEVHTPKPKRSKSKVK